RKPEEGGSPVCRLRDSIRRDRPNSWFAWISLSATTSSKTTALATGGLTTMKILFSVLFLFALLGAASTQVGIASAAPDQAFWVSYWAQPKIILYGPDEEAFYQNLKEVVFARNEWDRCQNPAALDDDANWLKAHPNTRFFLDGYASSRGETDYNL